MSDLKELIKANGTTYKLKVGELTKLEIDTNHYYFLDGIFLPGVTTIQDEAGPVGFGLKNFWQQNTKEDADALLVERGDLGIKMHDAFEKLLRGIELDLIKDYPTWREKKILTAFADWFYHFKPTKIESEQVVASKKFKYAGTLDCVCTIGGKRYLIDFKTTNGIYFKHYTQVLAYKKAYLESYGGRIDRTYVLRLGTTHKGNDTGKGKVREIGVGWEFRPTPKHLTINNFMFMYKTYLALHDGKVPEPQEVTVYPDKLQILEANK